MGDKTVRWKWRTTAHATGSLSRSKRLQVQLQRHSLIAYRQVARWHVDALLRGGNDRLEPRHNPQVGQGYSGAQLEIRD